MTKIFSYDQSFKAMQNMLNDFGLGSKNNAYAKFPEPLMDCLITFVIVFLLTHFAPVFYLGALGVAFATYAIARSFMDWDTVIFSEDIEKLSVLDNLYRRFPFRMISIAALLAAILTVDRSLPGRFDDVWIATGLFMACAVLTTILSDPTDSYPAESGRMWQFRMSITMAFIACGISMGPLLKDYMLSLPEGKAGTTETLIAVLPPAFFAIISLLCLGGTETKNKLLNKIARLKHVEKREDERAKREVAAGGLLKHIYNRADLFTKEASAIRNAQPRIRAFKAKRRTILANKR